MLLLYVLTWHEPPVPTLPPEQAVLDAYLCLVHLTLGIMVEALSHSFGAVAVSALWGRGGRWEARQLLPAAVAASA